MQSKNINAKVISQFGHNYTNWLIIASNKCEKEYEKNNRREALKHFEWMLKIYLTIRYDEQIINQFYDYNKEIKKIFDPLEKLVTNRTDIDWNNYSYETDIDSYKPAETL